MSNEPGPRYRIPTYVWFSACPFLGLVLTQRAKFGHLCQPRVDPSLHHGHDPRPRSRNHGGAITRVHGHPEGIDQNADEFWDLAELNRRGRHAPAIPPVTELDPALPRVPRDSQRRTPAAGVRDIQASRAHGSIMAPVWRGVEGCRQPVPPARPLRPVEPAEM